MLLLLLEPVVLLPCSFCFSSSSCSSCPPWCLVVLVVNVVPPRFSLPWLSSCSSYIFACVLVLLLEEQRRENPHATAGTFASKIVPSPVRRAYLPKLSSQKIHHLVTNSTEQQSAHRQMARISRQAFFPPPQAAGGGSRRRPSRRQCARPFFPGREPGRTHGASYPVAPLKWGAAPHRIALGKKLAP